MAEGLRKAPAQPIAHPHGAPVLLRTAHRADPEGKLVCHTCDNPPCVNPAHLFVGTDKDNAQDRERKGRRTLHRLSDETIATIRKRYSAGGITQAALCQEFGVSKHYMWRILHGRVRGTGLTERRTAKLSESDV